MEPGWWKIKREYIKCMRNLKYHKVAFEENLEELLLPLIADESKLQELLKDPGRLFELVCQEVSVMDLSSMKIDDKTISELDL